ncbi:SIR2-like domain-containing protein [Pedobacter suwonensis]|uniref:SIR2-like domain-containing protein n=1 Tax=Pedobacter suwonensis TaxID=332999 RepID=A0A1I0TXP0_9SPHI|nr:SIR2 family protein [Pedobacter suwonensis]SFA56532.1 SIR2-like domain-containing protein [Pedobacter suwonensis]
MEVKETFTSEQLKENDLAIAELIDFIKSGDAILMAGAGCSGSLFPVWGAFVDKLEQAAVLVDPSFTSDKTKFLSFADKAKECLQNDRYYSLIFDTFQPGEPTHLPFHEALCRLPFKAITTTNYDLVLEHAFTAVSSTRIDSLHFEGTTKTKIHQFLRSLNFNKNLKKMVVHLHGTYDTEDSIVLGGKEYSSKYGFEVDENEDTLFDQLQAGEISEDRLKELLIRYGYEWPMRRKLLWSLLATRRIVFLGFSMSDPYFIKMLDFVKNDLSTYNSESHFLILRVTPSQIARSVEQAARLRSEYGIRTVFFEDEEGQYPGMGKFVSEIENAINGAPKPIAATVRAVEEAVPAGNKELTDKLFSLSKAQYSDED